MKKACILAIFVLAAAATTTAAAAATPVHFDKKTIEVMKKIQTKFRDQHKRDEDSCSVLTCGKEGDSCDDNTICQVLTECFNGTCRQPTSGDPCEDIFSCHNESLYCSSSETCEFYHSEGDPCTSECTSRTASLVCDKTEKVCKRVEANPGEYCEYGTICLENSVCSATPEEPGSCVSIPSTAGEKCHPDYGCNRDLGLYCSEDDEKCHELPKLDEECVYDQLEEEYVCSKGLFCDSATKVCKEPKGLGDNCTQSAECGEGLACGMNELCGKEKPAEGGYCDDMIECDRKLMCYKNVCTQKNGTCVTQEDCIYYYHH